MMKEYMKLLLSEIWIPRVFNFPNSKRQAFPDRKTTVWFEKKERKFLPFYHTWRVWWTLKFKSSRIYTKMG